MHTYQVQENLTVRYSSTHQKNLSKNPDEIINLLKPLYVFDESGDYWGRIFSNHLEKVLRLNFCISAAALFYKTIGEQLIGLYTTYVDDTRHAGNNEYSKICDKKEEMLLSAKIENEIILSFFDYILLTLTTFMNYTTKLYIETKKGAKRCYLRNFQISYSNISMEKQFKTVNILLHSTVGSNYRTKIYY